MLSKNAKGEVNRGYNMLLDRKEHNQTQTTHLISKHSTNIATTRMITWVIPHELPNVSYDFMDLKWELFPHRYV